jgi:hypothetical protein
VAGVTLGKTVRKNGSIAPRGNLWAFNLPAGASVRLIGLDGRLVQKFEIPLSGVVYYQPQHAGILYAQVDIEGRRQVTMLPILR